MSNQRTVVFIIVGLTVAGGLCLLVCCGGLVHLGLGMASEEVRNELEADPRFVEHVGQVQEFNVDYLGSIGNEESDVWVYNVKGTKWSGRVTVKHETDADGDERVVWARFTLASGEKVELRPEEPEPAATAPDRAERDLPVIPP
jgi:hypothetical protein